MIAFQERPAAFEQNRDILFSQNNQNKPHPLRLPHWHEAYEILFVRRGWGEIQLNSDVFPFHPGDVVVIRPGDTHSNGYDSPNGCDIDIIQFKPSFLYRSAQEGSTPETSILHPEDTHIRQLFDAVRQHAEDDQPGHEQLLAGLIHLIVAFVLRAEIRQTARSLSPAIQAVCAHLETAADLRLACVAARFGYSPEHLSRKFHAETGVAYRQWCSRIRMDRAAAMLRQDAEDVSSIAEKLGYSDASSFIRSFRQAYGLTPSAYRRRCRAAMA